MTNIPLSKTWRTACLALSFLFAAACFGDVHAQANQPVPPQAKQFGPRVNKQQRPGQGGQAQRQQLPKTTTIAKHGDWEITCEEARKDASGKTIRPCGMVQSGRSTDKKKLVLTLVVIVQKQGDRSATMMRVMAPIGVFLPTGVALEIDGAAVGRVPFTRCLPQLCVAFAEASPPTLAKLKQGNKAKFLIYEAPGIGSAIELSLKGFTAALKELQAL